MDNFNCKSLYQASNYLPKITPDEEKIAEDAIMKAQQIDFENLIFEDELETLFQATVKYQRHFVSLTIKQQRARFPWLKKVLHV